MITDYPYYIGAVMKTKKSNANDIQTKLELGFELNFGTSDSVKYFQSPSSIILMGDHTQYNDGIMIATVVDSFVYFACQKSQKKIEIAYNNQKISGDLTGGFKDSSDDKLLHSLIHLINNLIKGNYIKCGFECFIKNETSKVFGLGNHAAAMMGFMKSLSSTSCFDLNNHQMVEVAVKSETELFGPVVSKTLFYASLMHKEHSLLYHDSRTDFKKFLPINENIRLVICNTNVEKENFHERCKDRIVECEVGVKGLRLYIWGIKNLRDVEEKFLERHIHMLPKRLYSRCLYNVLERKLVEDAYKHLRNNEIEEFAINLNKTHKLLAEHYEISSVTMDKLVSIAEESKICLGSKMVSCSYHDSTINLVYKKNLDKFSTHVSTKYVSKNGSELVIEDYGISEGANQLKINQKHTVYRN